MSKRTYKKYLKKQDEVLSCIGSQDLTPSAPSPKPVPAPVGQVDFFIQYKSQEYLERDIVEKIKERCNADGTKISKTDTLSIYLKPEDNKAYYTYADVSGFIEL